VGAAAISPKILGKLVVIIKTRQLLP